MAGAPAAASPRMRRVPLPSRPTSRPDWAVVSRPASPQPRRPVRQVIATIDNRSLHSSLVRALLWVDLFFMLFFSWEIGVQVWVKGGERRSHPQSNPALPRAPSPLPHLSSLCLLYVSRPVVEWMSVGRPCRADLHAKHAQRDRFPRRARLARAHGAPLPVLSPPTRLPLPATAHPHPCAPLRRAAASSHCQPGAATQTNAGRPPSLPALRRPPHTGYST